MGLRKGIKGGMIKFRKKKRVRVTVKVMVRVRVKVGVRFRVKVRVGVKFGVRVKVGVRVPEAAVYPFDLHYTG